MSNETHTDRRAPDPWRFKMEAKFNVLRAEVAANTTITNEILATIEDVREILNAARGAFKVLNWLGIVAKWVAAIAGAVAAVWALWHLGDGPKK